ncbi:MAG TPA: glycosyltransferase family 9 protein [Patescibacteria group bacterium]|nr:glycosyltransferase family 9 protein [Patescibacteria group bacterium]
MKEHAPVDLPALGDMHRIVVVRLKALGDIVLSLPIVYALRERYPGAEIRYLCRRRYAEALAGDTGLDGIIELPESTFGQLALVYRMRRRRMDLVIDLLSSPRSAMLTWLIAPRVGIGMDVGRHNWCYRYVLPRVMTRDGVRVKRYTLDANREIVRMLKIDRPDDSGGVRGAADAPRFPRPAPASWREGLAIGFPAAEREREWARRFVDGLAADRFALVGLVPAATYRAKSWPIGHFIELARILTQEMQLVPIVLWGPGEMTYADTIVADVPGAIKAPEMGIARLGALIAEMRLLVTLDSGPKHIAVLQGVPTVTLFGPTDPRVWDPVNERHRVVYHDMDCAPCRDRDCRSNRCLSEITPREVAHVVADLLSGMDGGNGESERRRSRDRQ